MNMSFHLPSEGPKAGVVARGGCASMSFDLPSRGANVGVTARAGTLA